MAERILANNVIIPNIAPVDLQTGTNAGIWVNMSNLNSVVAVFYAAIGTAGDDPVFTLKQATSAAGAGSKDLNFTTIYKKIAANVQTTAALTKVVQTAATSYTDTASAEAQNLIMVEIQATELDQANGFNFLNLNIPDTGSNAKLGCAFYVGSLKFGSAPEEQQNVIA